MATLPNQASTAIPNCELCGARLEHRGIQLHYHTLSSYGSVKCCDGCYEQDQKCWNSETQKMLLKLLHDRKLPIPSLNAEGFLPKD